MTNPRAAEFKQLYKTAIEHAQAGRDVEAEFAFSKAATFAPEMWCDIATKLAREGEETMALDHFRIALQVTKHSGIRSGVFSNIAIIYAKRGQLNQAVEMIDMARNEDPGNIDALVNLGQIRKWQGNIEASDRCAERALAMNPWHGQAQFLKALNTLDRADYARGFPLYECRWRSTTNNIRKVECFQPEWPGPGSVDFRTGKPFQRIFVYCEQGAGDVFLMLRYARQLRAAGLWQHWAVKGGMSPLVADIVDSTSEDGSPPEEFDCQIASASLPFIFKTDLGSIPPAPYLAVPGEASHYGAGLHIGVVWRGNKSQFNDSIRSTTLADWSPVFAAAKELGITLHSFQVDGEEEALLYPELVRHGPPKGWNETASRLAGLNLLISVDTGIVHLAGAMGLPVWCALHCRPYFVFPITLNHTPWYPSVRLFKQKQAYDWKPVFSEIANELHGAFAKVRA